MIPNLRVTALALLVSSSPICADGADAINDLVRPGFTELAQAAATLAQAARDDCDPQSADLRFAYHTAFDAWVGVSHFRFGPTETDDRAFALAFWPDTRGATPQTLAAMIASEDPAITSVDMFTEISIAARGFYALEFLLYDPRFLDTPSDYGCALIHAITTDIAATTDAISTDWHEFEPNDPDTVLYNALLTGLEFTADQRIGRPLGTFDRPRPLRAEARRSGRSLAHVELSISALRDLAITLASEDEAASARVRAAFDRAIASTASLDDPVFANVSDANGRFRLEVIQQQVDAALTVSRVEIGALLGVVQGFNALDGD